MAKNKSGKEGSLTPGITLSIPVSQRLLDRNHEPIVVHNRIPDPKDPDVLIELPIDDEDQPSIGLVLLSCISTMDPEKETPTEVILFDRAEQHIYDAVKAGEDYTVGQVALDIIQRAWRSAMARPNDKRPNNLAMSQVATAIGLKPPTKDQDMTGLE